MTTWNDYVTRWTEYAHGVIIDQDGTNFRKEGYFTFFLLDTFDFTVKTDINVTSSLLYRIGILKEIEKKEQQQQHITTYYGHHCFEIFKEILFYIDINDHAPTNLVLRRDTFPVTEYLYTECGKVDICFDVKHVPNVAFKEDRENNRNF